MKKVRTPDQRTREWVAVSQTELPPGAQRSFDTKWASSIAAHFDPGQLGYPLVALIPNRGGRERFWIIDGQHRIAAVKEALGKEQLVECEVLRDITLERAAELFRGRNHTRNVRPVDKFIAGVTAKDPECVAINDTVTSLGLRIVPANTEKGQISAVTALTKVHRLDPENGLLKQTLGMALGAWGRDPDSFNGEVIHGLGLVLHRYNGELETSVLEKRLAACPGGSLGVLGRGREARKVFANTLSTGIAFAIVRLYNTRRRGKALPEWGTRA